MKATLISNENNEGKFTMEFSADELEKAVVGVYQREKKNFQLDGFRRGKAPRSLIEKKYGENIFVEDAVNDLINREYPKAIDELELRIIDSPKVDFTPVEKGNDFTATVTVALYPEFDVTDYKGVEVVKVDSTVTEEDIDKEMKALQKRNGRMVDVDRPAKEGDRVMLDYNGTVDGEAFEGGSATNYPLLLGSNTFIPGFEKQLEGTSKGEEKDVVVTFPEDYHEESLAGKEAVFACKINEVKEEQLPELDDEFAKDISEFDTIEELRNNTAEELKTRIADEAETQMKDDALRKVYEANDIDVPDVMINDEVNNMMVEFDQQLRAQGMSLEHYIDYMGQKTEEFKEGMKDDALRRVKTRMIIGKIVEKENIEASSEDVDKELEMLATQYGMQLEDVKKAVGEQNISYMENDVKMKNAVDFIFENAVFIDAPEKKETEESEEA